MPLLQYYRGLSIGFAGVVMAILAIASMDPSSPPVPEPVEWSAAAAATSASIWNEMQNALHDSLHEVHRSSEHSGGSRAHKVVEVVLSALSNILPGHTDRTTPLSRSDSASYNNPPMSASSVIKFPLSKDPAALFPHSPLYASPSLHQQTPEVVLQQELVVLGT